MLFERQAYQEDCVRNIMQVLEGSDDLRDLSKIHSGLEPLWQQQGIVIRDKKMEPRLDVLMETGTGKTFTYIKTMYEMNKRFRLNKFVIFVPRLAIRAGIIQNIDLTADYFFKEYGKRIKRHAYADKKGLSDVETYIRNDREFSVLILTGSSIANKNANSRLLTRMDERLFDSKSPLKAIQDLMPVIFIDEPHLLKGDEFTHTYKKYFSTSLLLRFGATFPESKKNEESQLANVVYVLDSITAFRQYLVKKIAVSTIIDAASTLKFYLSDNKFNPITLHYFKEGLEYKQNLQIGTSVAAITGEPQHKFHVVKMDKKKKKVFLSNGQEFNLSSHEYILADEAIRRLIKQTIKIHFGKEERLFKKGIKALSLFFIPNIDDFRGDKSDEIPRIKKIFEEEYKELRGKQLATVRDAAYKAYLKKDYQDGKLCVHEGYFSGDKVSGSSSNGSRSNGSNPIGRSPNGNGSAEEKENNAINLILNDKTKLLSIDEPLRFVFSVWALQEGWDNPNIFTICKLAPAKADAKRRQQVGRGLRLAVHSSGENRRQTIQVCEENEDAFYRINTLDVVVSGQEKEFIEGLQREIIGNSITSKRFSREALLQMGLTGSQANHLLLILEKAGNIAEVDTDIYDIRAPIASFLQSHREQLAEKIPDIEKIDALINQFKTAQDYLVENINNPEGKVGIRQKRFKEFETLWKTITSKSRFVYKSIDDEKLIESVRLAFKRETIVAIRSRVVRHIYDHALNQIISDAEEDLGETKFLEQPGSYANFVTDFASRENLSLHFCQKMFHALDKAKIQSNPSRAVELLSKIVKEQIHRSVIPYAETKKIATTEKFFAALNRHKSTKGIEVIYKKRINKQRLTDLLVQVKGQDAK